MTFEEEQQQTHERVRQLYETGGDPSHCVHGLMCMARSLLDRTKIVPNLAVAKDRLRTADDQKQALGNEHIGEWGELYLKAYECYEEFVDDLLLLSAFELLAKARLLEQGYVIHSIDNPSSRRNDQKNEPLLAERLRAEGCDMSNSHTIGITSLLKPAYRELYAFNSDVEQGLEKIRSRRNLVHFNMGYGYKLTREILAAVEFLDDSVP